MLTVMAVVVALSAAEKASCTIFGSAGEPATSPCAFDPKSDAPQLDVAKISFDKDGLAGLVTDKHGCYWVHKSGTVRKTHCFDNGADYFVEDLTRYVNSAGLFGYMNKKLEITIPAKYDFAFPFEGGFANACLGCKLEPSGEHRAVKGGQWLILNKQGDVVKKCAKGEEGCALAPK